MKGSLVVLSFLTFFILACDKDEITSVQSESFIKFYSLNRSNDGACVCEIPGGGYALLGNTVTELRGSEICLILTDAFGNSIQDPKYYGNSGDDKGYCIKQASDGGFIILGSTENVGGDKDVFLIHTDNLGDSLWTRTFDHDQANKDDEGLWFDFNSKGDIMMVGYATDTGGSNHDQISKQIWIYYVDQYGNRPSRHQPITTGGVSDVDEARFIRRFDGDNFLITGVSKFQVNNPAASYSFIIYLRSNYTYGGYTESSFYISENDTSTLSDEANCLTLEDDTAILLCGSRKQTSGNSDAYLCRLNKIFTDENKFNPELNWIRYYNSASSGKATHMLMETNNMYILSTMSSGSDKSSTISIIATDMDGKNPVFMPIGGSSQMESRNFSFTADGGFIISGTNINNDINDISSMTLIKTKAGGKL